MRRLDLDPSYLPYLEEVLATQPGPIRFQDVQKRRSRMAELRRRSAKPVPDDVRVEEIQIPGKDKPIHARIYVPLLASSPPCVLYFHGGGWMYGSPEQSQGNILRVCQRVGAVVIAPSYRLAPEHKFPAAFEDCHQSLCWAIDTNEVLGYSLDRFAVMGESSGGNLAAACAIAASEEGRRGLCLQALNYPALGLDFKTRSYIENAEGPILSREDMMYFWEAYLGPAPPRDDPRAVPLAASDLSDLPPAFISVGEYDPLRDDGLAYARRLSAAGVPVEVQHARRLPHGFLRAWDISEDATNIGDALIAALRSALSIRDGGSSQSKAAERDALPTSRRGR